MDVDKKERILWKHLSSLPYFRGMLRAIEHAFLAEIPIEPPVLDLGAGDGHFASQVFEDHVDIGLDPVRKSLLEAKSTGVYRLLLQANGDTIPCPSSCISTVISNSVLEHIPDLQPVLEEVHRVLRVEGKFIFCVPNHTFLTALWGQKVLKGLGLKKLGARYNVFFNRIARHYHLYTPEAWQEKLAKAGFEIVDTWNYFPEQALHILERGHLFGLPNLIWKKVFGRWILFPKRWNPFIPFKRLRKFMHVGPCNDGTCTFFIARRKI